VSRDTAKGYAESIRRYGSEWITGIGSAIAALADFALQEGVSKISMRSAILSGDTLLQGMRASIESYFQCRCFDHYGQAEGIAMAMECSHGRMHVIPWLGIWEILRQDESPCAPGEVGEIAATGLLNHAMPLIRYRLGDYAAWAKEQSCPCGNQQPIIGNLEGRLDDYLMTTDGRRIGRISSAFRRPTIHSAQIVQDKPGHAYVLIRPAEGYSQADRVAIRDNIFDRIGSIGLDLIETSQIPKTPHGKTPLVVRLADRPALKDIYREIIDRQ
jgi:phenylacetate-CoA ligase